jgi:hypothetical protein
MDERARRLLAAGRDVLPRLDELLGAGADSDNVANELRGAIDGARESWQAEAVREILFMYAPTRQYLEEAVPESKSPRPFEGETRILFY